MRRRSIPSPTRQGSGERCDRRFGAFGSALFKVHVSCLCVSLPIFIFVRGLHHIDTRSSGITVCPPPGSATVCESKRHNVAILGELFVVPLLMCHIRLMVPVSAAQTMELAQTVCTFWCSGVGNDDQLW